MGNDLNEIRRSTVVSTFGPGAVVDFRTKDALVSGVTCGLEEWDKSFWPPGLGNPQRVYEERLQKKLNVDGFRLPPLTNDSKNESDPRRLVAVRFPEWLQCPNCDLIKPASRWDKDFGEAYRYCGTCTARNPGSSRVYVIPVRFVLACPQGHLDEFPWDYWVSHDSGCKNSYRGLKLKSEGPGLAGLILSCPKCNARRSMDGIFSKETWQNRIQCKGRRPWLMTEEENCKHYPITVQRGASNLYFPVIESALSIPPWADRLQEMLGTWWATLKNIPDNSNRKFYIELTHDLKPVLETLNLSAGELTEAIERRVTQYQNINTDDLRPAEYQQFIEIDGSANSIGQDFEIRQEKVPNNVKTWISKIVRAVRLREVRAISGFTRIHPPDESETIAPISIQQQQWLPAIEVRGEGIFLALDESKVRKWEGISTVLTRTNKCNQKHKEDWQTRFGEETYQNSEVSSRYILCHTLAHALMRQLTLECGYSAASLSERIYASSDDYRMAGILIYTSTPDADGTLGGLQRQGRTSRIEGIFTRAIQSLVWCSSDPLCITDLMGAIAGYSRSACHACVFSPETSCEKFNTFLDRAFLIGLPDDRRVGFFHELIH